MPSLGDRRTAALWLSGWIALWGVPARVDAVDMFWSNSRGDGSGTFSVAANWTESAPFSSPPPDSNDRAHFGMTTSAASPETYTVTFTTSPTNNQLLVEDDRVTFDLNSHVYTLTNTSVAVALGTESGRSGRLTVTDGMLSTPLQADIEIGSVAGGSGVLTVTTGGLALGSPEVFVGVNGAGTLNVNSNGDVIADDTTLGLNAGSTGTATITGGGSSLLAADLIVGNLGTGTLNVTSGGRIDSRSNVIGMNLNTTGTATVDGPGSKWDASSNIDVGRQGTGTLDIKTGSGVESSSSRIGVSNTSTGTVTVDGGGSRWDAGFLIVALDGNGELKVTNGGVVQSSVGVVGDQARGEGTITVSGPDAQWINNGPLKIGNFGQGTLNILDGAEVQSTDNSFPVVIGGEVDSQGAAIVDGDNATWTLGNSLHVGERGTGSLTVTGGGRVTTINPILGAQPTSTGVATVAGAGSTWTVNGFLGIGGDALFRADGGTGTLRIQAGGTVSGSLVETLVFDGGQLSVEGGTLSTGNLAFAAGATADTNFS